MGLYPLWRESVTLNIYDCIQNKGKQLGGLYRIVSRIKGSRGGGLYRIVSRIKGSSNVKYIGLYLVWREAVMCII